LGINGERPEESSYCPSEPRSTGDDVGSKYDVDIEGQGGGFSSRRRTEAIDSERRDRGVAGPPAGRRERKGVCLGNSLRGARWTWLLAGP
jgi:hypothetical protein